MIATAQLAPGVHLDPSSPAGKEYAIPLSAARAGTTGTVAGSPQLFGVGINHPGAALTNPDPSGSVAASGRSRRASESAHGQRDGGRAGAKATLAAATIPSASKVLGPGQGDPTGIWSMLAAAALVLVAGGVGGGMMARRR